MGPLARQERRGRLRHLVVIQRMAEWVAMAVPELWAEVVVQVEKEAKGATGGLRERANYQVREQREAKAAMVPTEVPVSAARSEVMASPAWS